MVARYLASPAVVAALEAAEARTAAAGVAEIDMTNPEVGYRHEDARGEAGARTDAVVGSVTLDLGFVAAGQRRAAARRGEAGPLWMQRATTEAVCAVRREVADLVAADADITVRERAQARLDALGSSLAELAVAGETSGYDRDRAALATASHRVALASSSGTAQSLRATLSARTGASVGAVRLAEVVRLPSPDELIAEALDSHPELAALRLEVQAATAAERAARRLAAPDLTLSGGARWDAPPERGPASPGFEVGAAVELPFFNTGKAEGLRASAAAREASATLAQRQAEIVADLRSAWGRLAAADALGPLGADPAIVWSAARERFAGGEASIDELLQTARDVEDAELSMLMAGALRRAAYLDLWCSAGRHPESAVAAAIEESLR